jgi:ubiquinone/menaquinone biosynthesis C-methylase UbiE
MTHLSTITLTSAMTPTSDTLDYSAITNNQRVTWSTGDFAVIGLSIVPVADALVEAADPHATARVLDVACGSGNVAIAAARRYCEVTGVDYVPALLERGRQRAQAEGTRIRFDEGDAQALPYADAAFDFVFSTFGVMFAPDQEQTARELLRVCRTSGTIALANWTPDGAAGEFFRVVSKHMPPAPGLRPPTRWGTEVGVRELFGGGIGSLRTRVRSVTQYYRSVSHMVDVFRTYFGPTARAFASLDPDAREALDRDLTALFSKHNRATDGTVVIAFEYLEALIEKK